MAARRVVRTGFVRDTLTTSMILLWLVAGSAPRAHAAASGQDLRKLSAALESLAARVAPSVVQIFTTAQVTGQGLVTTTGELVTTQRASGSGVVLDQAGYIQTDAPINPGSSGGPLVDTSGRLVEVNTLIVSQSGGNEGLGFAAPSDIVRAVFEQIRNADRVHRGEIGVSVQTITPALAAGLVLGRPSGVIVADVNPRGPAHIAGLRVGDVLLTLNGKRMENARQLMVDLYPRTVGEHVTLEVLRRDRRLRIPVRITERPADPRQLESLVDPTDNLVPRLGILALSLEPAVAARMPPLRLPTGIVVAASAADVVGSGTDRLRPADVIYAINGERVHTLEELQTRMEAFPSGDPVVVQVERRGRLLYLTFTAE